MTSHPMETPSARQARIAGLLYLAIIVGAGFAEGYVRGTLVVPGDAPTTAANIRAAEGLFRLGFVTDLVAFLCDAALAVLLYLLLRPVSRSLALVAAAFRLVQSAILGLNLVHHFAAVLVVGGAGALSAFTPEQLDALALLMMDVQRHGYLISQMFFGVHCALLGCLVVRAAYFPSVLGVLMAIAGVAYLADGFGFFLAPDFAARVTGALMAPVILAEVAFCLYLLVKGVKAPRAPEAAAA